MHLRRSFAGLTPARTAAGASLARYVEGHREGGCRYNRYTVRTGSGFARWLGQEFVRRHEYCDHSKRRESHSAGSRAGGCMARKQKTSASSCAAPLPPGSRCSGPRKKLLGSGMTAFERANAMEMIQAKAAFTHADNRCPAPTALASRADQRRYAASPLAVRSSRRKACSR